MKRLTWNALAAVPLLALAGCGGDVECQQVGDELVCVDMAEQAVSVDEQSNHGGCPGGGGGLGDLRLGLIDDLLSDPNTPPAPKLTPAKCDLADPNLCPKAVQFTVVAPPPGPTGIPSK